MNLLVKLLSLVNPCYYIPSQDILTSLVCMNVPYNNLILLCHIVANEPLKVFLFYSADFEKPSMATRRRKLTILLSKDHTSRGRNKTANN